MNSVGIKVCKFGGTSLADAKQIKKVLDIVRADPERQLIVVSAPGERFSGDLKVTDLLYAWHRCVEQKIPYDHIKRTIMARFKDIVCQLEINFDVEGEMEEIEKFVVAGGSKDYLASRGEYLMGKIIAKALGYKFKDSANFMVINSDRNFCGDYDIIRGILSGEKAVIPGFYGSLPTGEIITFERDGSDISAAIIARAVSASVCENWKDVSGIYVADPRVVENPDTIDSFTYSELGELVYRGIKVLHKDALYHVQGAGITLRVLNTNKPEDPGTFIVSESKHRKKPWSIIGIAGRKGFTVITVSKRLMNQQIGFARRILTVLEENHISLEHMPGGIDTLSFIIEEKQLKGKLDKVIDGIKVSCSPDNIDVYENMAMVATVGRSMIHTPGVAAKVMTALALRDINIRMINQGSSEISIIVGVRDEDCDVAVRAIYGAFIKNDIRSFLGKLKALFSLE